MVKEAAEILFFYFPCIWEFGVLFSYSVEFELSITVRFTDVKHLVFIV